MADPKGAREARGPATPDASESAAASAPRRTPPLETDPVEPGEPRDEWPVPWQPVWGTRTGLRRRLQARLLSALFELAARLPQPVFDGLLDLASWILPRFDRRHVEAGERFLQQALGALGPDELRRRIRQTYRHFLRVSLEPRRFRRRVPRERLAEHFDVRWTEDARRAVEDERGCLLVTGHIGNWEAAITAMPWMGFRPAYAVAKPPRNLPISQLVQREREAGGIRLLPRKGAMRDAPRILRAGGSIAMLVDQRARQRPILAPFFGRPARCDRSAGVLMKRVRAPALVCACLHTDRPLHYRIEFVDCLWPEELRELDPVAIATRINRSFEALIRAHPEQYFWIHDRYKKTPAELPEDPQNDEDERP